MPAPALAALGIGAGLKALGGLFGGIGKAKAAKTQARNERIAAQYKINMKQKGLNRKSLNFASLLKALGREGWYGDPNAEGSFMKTKGMYNASDFNYDPVPEMQTPGVLSSALGGFASGALSGASDWFMNDAAAGREAAGRVGRPTSPGQPTGGSNPFGVGAPIPGIDDSPFYEY